MPALDAVLFVAARNSEVDVVQSVGRVMRTFHKGASDEKKYGYIIVPVVVPADVEPEKAMEDNEPCVPTTMSLTLRSIRYI